MAIPPGIIVTGDTFVGLAAIYVALKYGSDSDDGFEISDTVEGQLEGDFEGARPVIDKVTVDTSPFYEWGSEADALAALRFST
jgi:hypothetical protein